MSKRSTGKFPTILVVLCLSQPNLTMFVVPPTFQAIINGHIAIITEYDLRYLQVVMASDRRLPKDSPYGEFLASVLLEGVDGSTVHVQKDGRLSGDIIDRQGRVNSLGIIADLMMKALYAQEMNSFAKDL